ncbi:MAG: hypothetical protein ACYC10_16090 [Allorhizobium sp.]
MLKIIAAGLLVCLASLGGLYFSFQSQKASAVAEAAKPEALEHISAELVTIPVLSEDAVVGYFLASVSLLVEKTAIETLDVSIEDLLRDELLSHLTGTPLTKAPETGNYDILALRTLVKDSMNERFRRGAVQEVLITQLDFISKADMRAINDPSRGRQTPVSIIDKFGRTANDILPPNVP